MSTAPEASREVEPMPSEECILISRTAADEWLVTSLDGRVIHRVAGTDAAPSLTAVWVGLAAGIIAGAVAAVLWKSALIALLAFIVAIVGVSSQVLARVRRRVSIFTDPDADEPALVVTEPSGLVVGAARFDVRTADAVAIGTIVGRRLVSPEGKTVARARAIAETALPPGVVADLGLASDRLGSECFSFVSDEGEPLCELRRPAPLLGSAMIFRQTERDQPLGFLALVYAVELFFPRRCC